VQFFSEYFFVWFWILFTTLVNIIAPLSGSSVVTPITAFFTSPQRAIGISAYILFFTGLHRVYLFRKEIFSSTENKKILKRLLPYSLLGAIMGGSVIVYLDTKILAAIVVIVSLYFIYSVCRALIRPLKKENQKIRLGETYIFLFTGFLQGAGMPGSDLRNNYLRTVISEVSLRGVTSFVGMCNFFISGSILLFHNNLTVRDFIFIACTVPFLFPIQFYGKKFLEKMSDRHAKMLAVTFSFVGVVLLIWKYFV